jgi:hypothetical protein
MGSVLLRVLAVSLLAVGVLAMSEAQLGPPPAALEAGRPARAVAAPAARLFLAGDGELWVVDVDPDRARRLGLAQLAPGDPPRRVVRRGAFLALWGYDVWRLEAADYRQPPVRLVAGGWIMIPSAHPDRVWVGFLDRRRAGSVRLQAVREIDMAGRATVAGARPPRGDWPHLAVGDRLLFARDPRLGGGWELWNPRTGRVTRRWRARSLADPGAAHGDLVASCEDPCRRVRLTHVRTGVQRSLPGPRGWRLTIGEFSPDGRTVALVAERRRRVRLGLADLVGGRIRLVAGSEVPGGYTFARWSRDGRYVFLTGGTWTRDRVVVAYRWGDASARRVEVKVGAFYDAAA